MSNLGWGTPVNDTFGFLNHWISVLVFILLAIFESAFDKMPKVDRLQDRLTMPYRLVCGAVAGAALVGHGTTGIVVGVLVGGVAAWLALRSKHETRPAVDEQRRGGAHVEPGEDLLVFGGTALTVMWAWVGYILFAIAMHHARSPSARAPAQVPSPCASSGYDWT